MNQDKPVFDHSKSGQNILAERRDQTGAEVSEAESSDMEERRATEGFAHDSLFHPDRPFVDKHPNPYAAWPTPRRG